MEQRYNVFSLCVVTYDNHKYICGYYDAWNFREVLTGKPLSYNKIKNIEALSDYYSVLAVKNYVTGQPLMLTKLDILEKYLSINDKTEEYYPEKTSLESIIDIAIETPDLFYKKVSDALTKEERKDIKTLVTKNCENCLNEECQKEKQESPYFCNNWDNGIIIGKYKVLNLNRKK